MRSVPFLLRTWVFVLGSVLLAALLVFASYRLYLVADKRSDFLVKLGEYALQVAIIVLAGAAVKQLLEWRATVRMERTHQADLRREFLRRLRAVHITVLNARDLMAAHRTPKTWAEQSRKLIESIPVLQEIGEDLQVAEALFGGEQEAILKGIEGMAAYLERCRHEYMKNHEVVGSNREDQRLLESAIDSRKMAWTSDFMDGKGSFEVEYVTELLKAKLPMREAVMSGGGIGRGSQSIPALDAGSSKPVHT
jgi:hypothetical protein